ncbi:hypothetical protein V7S43_018280 [Phytophthora oleae]|uniref:Uncharacterized protein n=1 Tax=Phytophthora oleae TaxID=2107226 RepID=A0ABD3EQW4_9STRA
MTVRMAVSADGEEEAEEQYELLSFAEDPGINHVCTFKREDDGGYNIFKTGAIHQKLLVQRLLDATEKDRIKDKHAKSVLASKSRASKLIDTDLEKPAKRQRLTKLSRVSTSRASTGGSAWSIAAGHKRTSKLVLPSALTKEEAKVAKEKIEKGFEVEEVAPIPSQEEENTNDYEANDKGSEEASVAVITEQTTAAARDAEFHSLFSSDSDDEKPATGRTRVLRREEKRAAPAVKSGKDVIDTSTSKQAKVTDVDATAQTEESSSVTTGNGTTTDVIQGTISGSSTTQSMQSGETVDIYALKPIKPSSSGVEVKRARVRSALVSDRVKQARLPDLSFFPSAVVQICQRLANYRGRSVILDATDYDVFVETHEQFRQDWETLDKVYSIEMIKAEGLHLQLEVDPDANQEQLQERIQASASKKEGLLFVRDAMVSIQNILQSIQRSVDRFDLKAH